MRIESDRSQSSLPLLAPAPPSVFVQSSRSPRTLRFSRALFAAASIALVGIAAKPIVAQESAKPVKDSNWAKWEADAKANEKKAQSKDEIYFSFDRMPWRDVIQWIADEANVALHYEELPPGSFSYDDPNPFSTQAAIDRLNLFLLPQGFSLVQSGKLLSVINLGDPRSLQTLDQLARFVKLDQLDDLPTHDVVKCMFPLGELEVEDALEELSVLKLMTQPAPFNKTKQLMITDTVGKLLNVKAIIESFQPSTLDNGTVMRNFALKHVEAEDILGVARPHLGLATGEMIGIDVSISADLQGQNIFVTGVEDKVKLIEGLVKDLDVPKNVLSAADGEATLKSHFVEGGNVDTVYNVLQTLLAGKQARVSIDEDSSSVVAFASPVIQDEIAQTVAQLAASEPDFEIINLQHVDPYFVISLLEEMLDLPTAFDDPDDVDPDAPTIDADPGNMRLFVRGKRHRIDQIKKIVDGLDVTTIGNAEKLRLLPMRGSQAEKALQIRSRFWDRDNPVIYFPSEEEVEESTERTLDDSADRPHLTTSRRWDSSPAPRYLTDRSQTGEPPIRAQMTPRGLMIQCEDTDALDAFEEELRMIAGPTGSLPSKPIVFYLKYVKPDSALRMLAELLDGGETAEEAEAGTLVNGLVSSFGDYNPSLLTSRDGLITLMAGTITVVADPRLNRLIAQGSMDDIDRIEAYLKIIDKSTGITEVATYGTSHIIELQHTEAAEIAQTVRDAYANRIASNAGGAAGVSGQDPRAAEGKSRGDDRGEENPKAKKSNRANSGGNAAQALEPVMTVAVHERSNSIIITDPDQLFAEVDALVTSLDTQSQETVEVINPGNSALLQAMFGEGGSGSSTSRGNSNGRSSSSR
ncbi:MAG: secretin N-terminal domain-containing protein, partial [Planctomycetota bacterium]